MAQNIEGMMSDALDAAASEAISEFEAGQDAEVSEDADVEYEEVADEDGDEAEYEAPDVEESDETGEPAESDIESSDGFEWDGNPDHVPAELRPYYDKMYETMRKGVDMWMSKRASEQHAEKQEMQRRIAEMESQLRDFNAPKEPTRPGQDATQDDWDRYYDDRARWIAAQEHEKFMQSRGYPDPGQMQVLAAQQEAIRRANMIEAQPGYTDEIGLEMVRVAESNPYWAQQINTDEGLRALFDVVKQQKEAAAYKDAAAKANSAEIQRKASAVKRKVSKPKASSKPATPSRNFAEMGFEERIDAAIADTLKELG
jgi:hypothetical protein